VHAVTILGEALKNAKLLGEGRLFAETALARLAGHRDMRFLDQMVRELAALERRIGAGPAATPSPTAPVAVAAEAPAPSDVGRAKAAPWPARDQAARRGEPQGERLTAAERAAAETAPITRTLEKELKARIVHMEREPEA